MRIVVGKVTDFEPGDRQIVEVGRRSIGVFRVGDRFYALNNHCPHQGGPLCVGRTAPWVTSSKPGEFGMAENVSLLACPWHGWEYDLATGQSFLGPGEPPVRSYDVSVQSGDALSDPDDPESAEEIVYPQGREPGPYIAETYPVAVEEEYVVVDTRPKTREKRG